MSRQCPLLIGASDCSRRAGISRMTSAEKTNDTALIQYAACVPGDRDDRAADDRAGGPRHVLDGLEERVAALELVLLEQVRHRRR